MSKIYISPSDQWSNIVADGSHSEAHHCTEIAAHLADILMRSGYEVKIGDNSVEGSYKNRVSESNNWGADLHIPIHTNAGGGDGAVVFCHSSSIGNDYVKSVYAELEALTPTQDDGIRAYDSLYEIRGTKAKCVYVEAEFHDSIETENWIHNNIHNIALAIARGICNVDGKQIIDGAQSNGEIHYTVQVGAYNQIDNARNMVNIMKDMGYDAFIKEV